MHQLFSRRIGGRVYTFIEDSTLTVGTRIDHDEGEVRLHPSSTIDDLEAAMCEIAVHESRRPLAFQKQAPVLAEVE